MKNSLKKLLDTMSRRQLPILTTAGLVLLTVGFQNCQRSDEYFPKDELISERNVRLCQDGTSNNLICNPFGGPGTGDDDPSDNERAGLIGHLFEGEANWNHIGRYLDSGYQHPEAIYFSNFNVPKRSFSDGFLMGSDFLKDRIGEKLIEWFALQVKGHLVLPSTKLEGSYHIATLSDDGIRVIVGGNALINNPGTHAVTLDCANATVDFRAEIEKDFELQYFQGPRHHIALMVFIKRIESPGTFNTANCAAGNTPEDLLAAGYEVMSPAWFTLPAGY